MRGTNGRYAQGQLIVDPNAEEEALMEAVVSVALSESGELVGVFKPGGTVEAGGCVHDNGSFAWLIRLGSFAWLIHLVHSLGSYSLGSHSLGSFIRSFVGSFRLNYGGGLTEVVKR